MPHTTKFHERTRNRRTRMAEAIRVLIADDQALLRGSFRVLVDSTPAWRSSVRRATAPRRSGSPANSPRTSS